MSLKSLAKKINVFVKDENGASGIEYAIVATLVAVVLISFAPAIKTALTATFQTICTALNGSACTFT